MEREAGIVPQGMEAMRMGGLEFIYWTIFAVIITIEIFCGVVAHLYLSEVDKCHR